MILRPVVICELTENRLIMNRHSDVNTVHKKKKQRGQRAEIWTKKTTQISRAEAYVDDYQGIRRF